MKRNRTQLANFKYQKQLMIIKLQGLGIKSFTINDDLSIDINQYLTVLPIEGFTINKVTGYCRIEIPENDMSNIQLPKYVNGDVQFFVPNLKTFEIKSECAVTGLTYLYSPTKLLNVKTYSLVNHNFSASEESIMRPTLSPQFSDDAPISKLVELIHTSLLLLAKTKKIFSRYEILSRLDEFDVITNDSIDYLSLSNLLEFYEIDIQQTKFKNQIFKNELISWGYKIIE